MAKDAIWNSSALPPPFPLPLPPGTSPCSSQARHMSLGRKQANHGLPPLCPLVQVALCKQERGRSPSCCLNLEGCLKLMQELVCAGGAKADSRVNLPAAGPQPSAASCTLQAEKGTAHPFLPHNPQGSHNPAAISEANSRLSLGWWFSGNCCRMPSASAGQERGSPPLLPPAYEKQ